MLEQAYDFREESRILARLLVDIDADEWQQPTLFKGWTIYDVIGHLHLFNVAAGITLDSKEQLFALFDQSRRAREQGLTLVEFTRDWLGHIGSAELLTLWSEFAEQLAERYVVLDPARRVAWGGPDMSVRSCISARQMETWAHGQAVFDLLGVEREEGDRLRNIAIMGVNTFAWTFRNRGLPVPEQTPCVRLEAPSGAIWEWNPQQQGQRVEGLAVDFCRVVTQTRNVLDTSLQVSGDSARQWMTIAQCFAGPPQDPPAFGSRYCQVKMQ